MVEATPCPMIVRIVMLYEPQTIAKLAESETPKLRRCLQCLANTCKVALQCSIISQVGRALMKERACSTRQSYTKSIMKRMKTDCTTKLLLECL